jgi:hypothetical protein
MAAAVAFTVMHANHISANWATMGGHLIFEKFIHALLFEHFEVFNHAHAVAVTVSLV